MHRKTIKHFHRVGDFHEFTFSCYRRSPLLVDDRRCLLLAEALDRACLQEEMDLVAYVFMPEHVHLLVYPRIETPDLGRFLALVKQPTSKAIKSMLESEDHGLLESLMVPERPGKTCFRFWQEGPGYDRNVYSPKVVQTTIDYIHNNPVRRGLCLRPTDWKWSSIHFYEASAERRCRIGPPRIHSLH